MAKEEIIQKIKQHILSRGGGHKEWYVGIASDPKDALFTRHKVKNDGDVWIYENCGSSDIAREVEYYFVSSLGTAGGPGGGDYTTHYIYAYKIAPHTVETA